MSADTLVDIVIPAYNEEEALEGSIATLSAYLEGHCPYRAGRPADRDVHRPPPQQF